MHWRETQTWRAAFSQGERMGGCSGGSSMNEQAAASCIRHLGGLEPAGSHRAQQRGQSPHTAAMWPPDGIRETLAALHSAKKKGNVELLWLTLVCSFTPFFILNCSLLLPAAGGSHLTCFHHQTPEETERKQKYVTHLNFTTNPVYR